MASISDSSLVTNPQSAAIGLNAKFRSDGARSWSGLLKLVISLSAFGLALLILLSFNRIGSFGVSEHVLGWRFELASAGLGIWLGIILYWWSKRRGLFDLFEMPVWVTLNTYGQVVLTIWLLQRDALPPIALLRSQDYQTLMTEAVLLIGFGLTAMWVGYVMASPALARIAALNRRATAFRFWPTFIIWLICWGSGILATLSGVYGYAPEIAGWSWTNYLDLILLLTGVAQVALIMRLLEKPSLIGWVWIALAIGTHIAISLAAATRGAAFIFIQIMVAYFYLRRRVNWRLVGIAGLGFLILAPTATAVRTALLSRSLGESAGYDLRFGSAADALGQLSLSGAAGDAVTILRERQGSMLHTTAIVISLHPRILPWVGIDILEQIPPALLPRIIWPEKPNVDLAAYQTTQLYRDAGTGGGTAIGLFADSYRWGGLFPMAIIMFAFGVFSALLYYLGPATRNLAGIAVYAIVLVSVFTYEASIFKVIMDSIQKALPLFVIATIFFYSRSSTRMREMQVAAPMPGDAR